MSEAVIDRRLTDEVKRMSFKLHSAGSASLDASWNWRDYYLERSDINRIWMITGGSVEVSADERSWKLTSGNTYFIPAGMPFTGTASRVKQFWIDFNIHVFAAEEVLNFVRTKEVFPVANLDPALLRTGDHQSPAAALMLMTSVYAAVTAYLERHATSIDTDRLAVFGKHRELIGYISKENLSLRLSIRTLGARTGMSDYYLSSQFKADMGISLKKYIEKLVFEESARRLLASDDAVKTIAKDLGFANEFYFSNFFKRHARRSPSAYRAHYRAQTAG